MYDSLTTWIWAIGQKVVYLFLLLKSKTNTAASHHVDQII
jgi:hypothetical protein